MRLLVILLLFAFIQISEIGATHIMVVTNRRFDPTTQSFGNGLVDSLQYCVADIFGGKYRTTPHGDFHSLARFANQQLPLLVFVHGDGKTYNDVLRRAFELSEFYRVNVLLFTYPTKTEGLGRLSNLNQSMINAKASIGHLSCMMDTLAYAIKTGELPMPVSWFFHSLGNYLLAEMLINRPPACISDKVFANFVLNAAAVDQRNHLYWLARLNCAQSVVVNMNKRDLTLLGAQVFSPLHLALGRKIRNGNLDRIIYMKFNKVLGITGRRDAHSYYYGNAVHYNLHIRGYYETLLAGRPINQLGYVKRMANGTWYISPSDSPKRRGKQY